MRDEQHQRRQRAAAAAAADDLVEQPFHHHVPVGDRLVEHVEHRDVADIGIGARPEAQLVGMRREPDVDRQHPQLLQHLQDARLGRDRQREDHEVDAGAAREFDEVVDRAELGEPAHDVGRAVVAAVVEHADHADVGVALRLERLDQRSPRSPPPTTMVRRSSRPSRVQPRTSRNSARRRKPISTSSRAK